MSGTRLKQAALSGARWTVAARIGLQLFTWPITIVVMRLLEPHDYGVFAIAMVVAGCITLFSEFGLGVALVQAEKVGEDSVRIASTVVLALNCLVALTMIVLAPWAADWFDEPELALIIQVLTLDLVMTALATVPQAMLERQLRFRQLSIAMMAAGASASAATLAAAWLDLGVWALVAGNLTLGLVRSALLIYFYGRVVWPSLRFGAVSIAPLLRFGSQVVTMRALWYWYGQADQIILARLLHASLLGFYSVASQLAMLPAGKAMETFNRVAFPILSRLRSDPVGLKLTHRRLFALVGIYGFSFCWGLAAVAPEFVSLVLGDKWTAAATPLMLLALVAPLRMFCSVNNLIATAVGAPQAANKELAFASLLVPLAVLAGAWSGGLDGAALAWLIAYPLVYLLSNALTCAAVGSRARDGLRPLAAPFAAGLIMLAAVWAVRLHLGSAHGLPLLLAAEIAAGALSYLVTLQLASPTLVSDARALALELLRPGRTTTS